jgi:WD40 repeat protein
MPDLKPDDFVRVATLYAPDTVTSLAISPNGRTIAIAAGDKLHIHSIPVTLSDATSVTPQQFPRLVTLFMPDKVQSIVYSPDGKLLTAAIADKVHIYRVPD